MFQPEVIFTTTQENVPIKKITLGRDGNGFTLVIKANSPLQSRSIAHDLYNLELEDLDVNANQTQNLVTCKSMNDDNLRHILTELLGPKYEQQCTVSFDGRANRSVNSTSFAPTRFSPF